jgi:hypothetical protein
VLPEERNSFLRLLKNKGFKEESRTKVRLYTMGTSTTPESNKSPLSLCITSASEVKRCWVRSLSYSSHKTPESNKSDRPMLLPYNS